MKWADVLHADANSGKLRITLIIFGGGVVKNGHGTFRLNLTDFLHANTYSGKLKATLIVIGWV